jgi:UDP-N-acetylmuramyl pentapeptide phosphotransferase/UDP-N-acetylglucosamine-1-phosphate transferase
MNTPNAMMIAVCIIGAFAVTWVGVEIFRRWTLRRGLLDHPNERSSHSSPTPRGGGVVITIVCLAGYFILHLALGLPMSSGYAIGAIIVAGISWLDDIHSLPFWVRLPVHIIAAVVLVYDAGYWSEIAVPWSWTSLTLPAGVGIAITVAWVVWFLNAYNFMDGIDGIAASQAIVASVAWGVTTFLFGGTYTSLFSFVIAGSSLGFLLHNWQPAKIFMGDVGSGFLGFTLAALPVLALQGDSLPVPVFPLLGIAFVWFFLADTIFTLLKRLIRGQRIWEAHREHAYQQLVRSGWQHASVTLIYSFGATLVSLFALLAVMNSGIFTALTLFSLVVPTLAILGIGIRNSR